MPAIFDFLYRKYCRARLAEMRKQLLISPERHEVPEAICDAKDAVGASPTSHVSGGETAPIAPLVRRSAQAVTARRRNGDPQKAAPASWW
jgi:hypothetical protein